MTLKCKSNGSINSNLTVLIPTKNRPDQLNFALNFYNDQLAKYRFIILDASNPTIKSVNQRMIESIDLELEYHCFDEGVGVNERIRIALNACKTDLVLLAGDDDLIFPRAIDNAISFLNERADYSACHGRGYSIAIGDSPEKTGALPRVISRYSQREFEGDDPIDRFRSYVHCWSTMAYSVQRTALMKNAFHNFIELGDDVRFMEFYWYAYLVLIGKVKRLDELYIVRMVGLRKHWSVDHVDIWAKTDAMQSLPIVVRLLLERLEIKRSVVKRLVVNYCELWILSRQKFSLRMILHYPWWYFTCKIKSKVNSCSTVNKMDRIAILEIFSNISAIKAKAEIGA